MIPEEHLSLQSRVKEMEVRLLTGRGPHMEALDTVWREASAAPQVVYIFGPAQIGKTALVTAFLRRVRDQGSPALLLPADAGPIRQALEEVPVGSRPVLVVDPYDTIPGEPAFRHDVLYHLAAPALLVLVGRTPPEDLWPRDEAWRRLVRTIEVGPLREEDARVFLEREGAPLGDRLDRIIALAEGHPVLLGLGLYALRDDHVRRAEEVLVEQACEAAWPGHGEEIQEAFAAAALLPRPDRRLLGRMIGENRVDVIWEHLQNVPGVLKGPRDLILPGALAAYVRLDLSQRHPGKDLRLRLKALEAVVSPSSSLLLPDRFALVRHLARETIWYRWFEAGGLPPHAAKLVGARIVRKRPGRVEVVLSPGAEGERLASSMTAWLETRPFEVLFIRDLDPGPLAESALRALGFRPTKGGWSLSLPADPSAWLRSLSSPAAPALTSFGRMTGTTEVLDALAASRNLTQSALGTYLEHLEPGDWPPRRITAYVEDALDALREEDPVGARLLVTYYLSHRGSRSHDRVAEEMDLPRTTYFRRRSRAISRLGDVLFGAFDSLLAPPSERRSGLTNTGISLDLG